MTMQFDIRNRVSGDVQVSVEINPMPGAPYSERLGLAVLAAIKAGANLRESDLRESDLQGVDLGGVDLRESDLRGALGLFPVGMRSDGYEFFAQKRGGDLWIKAGCRYFPVKEARKHWKKTRGGTPLGAESLELVKNAVALHKIRTGK